MFLILFSFFFHQELTGWELLSTVEIVKGYDEFMSAEIEKPQFPELLTTKEGTNISLEGFIIPLQQDTKQDYFVLSRFPFQSCFFCGAAGPETVVEVYSDHEFSYTDERVRVSGKLRLNDDNPLHLFYILEDSEVEKVD
ncbi:MAG: hypothetical protein RIM99_11145 [Cyclobacteriaceae bacterium]